jgi:hypothetical protein
MIDPTVIGAAVTGVIAAAVLGTIQIIANKSAADKERALEAERAKDREEAAAIRAQERAEAAEDRKAMLLKASKAVEVSEANGKKSDEIITGVAKVHELTNSTNSQLQKSLEVVTEKLAGAEKMIGMLLQQIKDTSASQATADLQVSAAMHTTPILVAPLQTTAAPRLPNTRDGDATTLDRIESNTAETAAHTANLDEVVEVLRKDT